MGLSCLVCEIWLWERPRTDDGGIDIGNASGPQGGQATMLLSAVAGASNVQAY